MKYHFCIYMRNYADDAENKYVHDFLRSYINKEFSLDFPNIQYVSTSNDKNDFYVMSQMKAMCTYYSFVYEVTESEHTANLIQDTVNTFARQLAENIARYYRRYQTLLVMIGNFTSNSLLHTEAALDIRFKDTNLCSCLTTRNIAEWRTYDSSEYSPFSYTERLQSWLNGLPVGRVTAQDHCIFIMRIYW